MSIVDSQVVVGHAQRDGRHYVFERHTDHLGVVYASEYGPVTDEVDANAVAAAHAVALAESLAESEFGERLQRIGALALQHQTGAQFAARLRELYRNLSRAELAALAWWIVEQINAGHITDAQVRNAFGMTTQRYTTFKADRLVPMHDRWAALQADVGE